MKFPSIQNIPSQLISEPSETDLKYMDDYEDYPSQDNLQASMASGAKDGQSLREKGLGKAQNIQAKISKKKPLAKEQKGGSSMNGIQMKRIQSQSRGSNLNYTKLYSKRSSEFREVKFSQFQFIYKTFCMLGSQYITFNELILGLKSLGVEIETEKKFQAVKNIYDQFVGKNDLGLDFEMFGKIAVRLLKDERIKPNSDLLHIEKSFYYMVQEANKVQWPFSKQEQSKNSQKELFNEFKTYVDRLPSEKRYLNKDSLTHLAKYLGMEKELTPKDIETIMKFGDKEEKGYLSLEDVMRCINGNKIVDV